MTKYGSKMTTSSPGFTTCRARSVKLPAVPDVTMTWRSGCRNSAIDGVLKFRSQPGQAGRERVLISTLLDRLDRRRP